MSGIATAIGLGVATTAVGIYSANKASSAEQNAANSAESTQMQMFNQTNANQAPFRQEGVAADKALGSFYGLPGYGSSNASQVIQNLPGYQFQMQQGTQAIDRQAAANGLLNSGATGKALTQYGQGLAGSYMGQYTSGLQNLANLGEGATQATSYAGANAANQISNAQIYGGQAQASGDINTTNAITSGLDQGIGLYGLSQGGFFGQQRNGFNAQQANANYGQYMNNYNVPGYAGGPPPVPQSYLTGTGQV